MYEGWMVIMGKLTVQALYSYLYHAIENTANHNAEEPLYWFVSMLSNIPIMQRNDFSVGLSIF